jgi:hypothetical protein
MFYKGKMLILFICITFGCLILGMHQESTSYTRISRLTAGKETILRATKIPEGTSIEVIHYLSDKSYYGTESAGGDTGDRNLFDEEAARIFKELEQIK